MTIVLTPCPIHGRYCHRLCRFYQKTPRDIGRWKRDRTDERLPELKRATVRRIASVTDEDAVPARPCPVHRHKRHPRICRFCRADNRADAPPIAPSECAICPTGEAAG